MSATNGKCSKCGKMIPEAEDIALILRGSKGSRRMFTYHVECDPLRTKSTTNRLRRPHEIR